MEELEEEVRRLRWGGDSQRELGIKPSRPPKEKRERKQRDRSYARRKETPDEVRYPAMEQCPADPAASTDNNLVECSLRPTVIARKISGDPRSAKGFGAKIGLVSLAGTWTAQGKPLLESFRHLLLSPPPPDAPCNFSLINTELLPYRLLTSLCCSDLLL